jgi:hypothetical protein
MNKKVKKHQAYLYALLETVEAVKADHSLSNNELLALRDVARGFAADCNRKMTYPDSK